MHRWRYHLRDGSRLYREFAPVGAEAVLLPDGTWLGTHLFLDIRSTGEVVDLVELDLAAARGLVASWQESGQVESGLTAAELAPEFVPGDYAERADRAAERTRDADVLRSGPGLSGSDADAVRATVFGGRDLAPTWAAAPGRVVVPVQYVDALALADERGHIVDAYRSGGVDELWLVTRTPEPRTNQALPPHGVVVPATDAGLTALTDLLYLTEHVVCDPAGTRLLMDLGDYWLVGGPSQFVADVLGQSIPGAYAAFREYAAEADGPTADLLAAVLAEHPPPA